MEYIHGTKIDQIETIKSQFGEEGPLEASKILVKVFGDMIFKHGFVHCDAHPGNIFVRPNPANKNKLQIVLLDHGFYCTLKEELRQDFSKMWYAMNTMNYDTMETIAKKLGVGQYFRYLPLLFTYRTINAKKPLGGLFSEEEKKFIVGNDEINFEKLSLLMQKLPQELIFIFKAMHIIGVHNKRSGGTTRDRLVNFTDSSIEALNEGSTKVYTTGKQIIFRFKLWMFEKLFWLYNIIYGFKEYNVPDLEQADKM